MMRTHLASKSAAAWITCMTATTACMGFGKTELVGEASLQAGNVFEQHSFGVPTAASYTISDAGVSQTSIQLLTSMTSSSMQMQFNVSTTGPTGDFGGGDMYVQFVLTESVYFTLEGALSGLTIYEAALECPDNSFLLIESVFTDADGSYGTLIDPKGNPMSEFFRSGILQPGAYEFLFASYSETLPGQPAFTGSGSILLTLTIPTPSTLLAIALPGAFALRRRR